MECAIVRISLDGHFTGVGELDGVADKINEDLGQAPPVAVARGQLRSDLDFEPEFLVGRQRLQRAADGLRDVLNAVIGKFEFELASLDLG